MCKSLIEYLPDHRILITYRHLSLEIKNDMERVRDGVQQIGYQVSRLQLGQNIEDLLSAPYNS
jgi:hypothetical protein